MGEDKAWWRQPAVLFIVAGNLVPLAGVLFFGWQLLAVMLAFWLDSVAIGIYTAGRIVLARLDGKAASGRSSAVTRVYRAVDFTVQYAFISAVHGLLIIGLFGGVADKLAGRTAELEIDILGVLGQRETLVAAAAVLLTRGMDFVSGYLRTHAYEQADIGKEQSSPYRRSYLQHVVVVLGGGISLALHSPVAALVLLVVLKTAGDLIARARQIN